MGLRVILVDGRLSVDDVEGHLTGSLTLSNCLDVRGSHTDGEHTEHDTKEATHNIS